MTNLQELILKACTENAKSRTSLKTLSASPSTLAVDISRLKRDKKLVEFNVENTNLLASTKLLKNLKSPRTLMLVVAYNLIKNYPKIQTEEQAKNYLQLVIKVIAQYTQETQGEQ